MKLVKLAAASALVLAAACGGLLFAGFQPARDSGQRGAAALPIDEDARAEARWIYDTRCTWCHGTEGAGDGEGARDLAVPSGDFRRSERVAEDHGEYLEAIILRGGPAVGRSALMPPNPDLKAKPQVVTARGHSEAFVDLRGAVARYAGRRRAGAV